MRTSFIVSVALGAFVYAQTPPNFTPSIDTLLPASYGNLSITPGLHIPENATVSAPTIAPLTTPSVTILIDLDAPYPGNNTISPLLHWIISSTNTSVVPYVGPQPPQDSPQHRYTLLSYALPANSTGAFVMPKGFESVGVGADVMSRATFDLAGFVKAAGLSELKAANWFTVSPENGNQTTATPPPEEYQGAASKGVGIGSVGMVAAVAGVVAMIML